MLAQVYGACNSMLMEGHLKLLLPTFKQNYDTIEFTLLP